MAEETRIPEKKYYLDVNLEEAETNIHACLRDAARNVIAVGFYLKRIRDRELYQDAGYKNIWDYAAATFGFSKSTASRYMARNDRFSVDGNSPKLAEQYRDYSKAQLQEMLNLDADQLEDVTPGMTVREIRELKRPKELPYYDIPGQLNISDFPGMDDAGDDPDAAVDVEETEELIPERGSFSVTAEDLIEDETECVATSQQKEPTALPNGGEAAAEKQQEECANVEIEKIHNAQEEPEKQELIEYDQEILDGMIREVRQKLYIMKEYWIKSQPQYYTKHRMMLRAYELLMKAGS